jgi:hypothetical protein
MGLLEELRERFQLSRRNIFKWRNEKELRWRGYLPPISYNLHGNNTFAQQWRRIREPTQVAAQAHDGIGCANNSPRNHLTVMILVPPHVFVFFLLFLVNFRDS